MVMVNGVKKGMMAWITERTDMFQIKVSLKEALLKVNSLCWGDGRISRKRKYILCHC